MALSPLVGPTSTSDMSGNSTAAVTAAHWLVPSQHNIGVSELLLRVLNQTLYVIQAGSAPRDGVIWTGP